MHQNNNDIQNDGVIMNYHVLPKGGVILNSVKDLKPKPRMT